MLGTFRWSLAVIVTLGHLWSTGETRYEGIAAVYGFFLLSGYLMTSVINRTYGFTASGVGRYALNRALRIYPAYWIVMLLTIPVVMKFPVDAFHVNPRLVMPISVSEWLPNIFIFGLLDGPSRVLVPPAWSLDIELFFYIVMGLGLSRSRPVVLLWFLVSLAYTVWLIATGADIEQRYATYAASSLPFSLGAMTYMYRDALKRYLCLPLPVAAPLFACVVVLVSHNLLGDSTGAGFYIHLATIFLLLISLNNFNTRSLSGAWRKVDKLLGDLAYPVFLCHWFVGALVLHFGFAGKMPEGGTLWIASIVLIHLISLLVYYLVDYNVNRLRDIVRGTKRADF